MLLYITLGTNDLVRATQFYDATLGALGKPAAVGNGSMPALCAASHAEVDAFHAAAIANGGTDEGKPGLRPFGPSFYACYVRDPDGNKLSAVCETAAGPV